MDNSSVDQSDINRVKTIRTVGCTIKRKLKEGYYKLADYDEFSKHPEWRVRCSVAVGLLKKKEPQKKAL